MADPITTALIVGGGMTLLGGVADAGAARQESQMAQADIDVQRTQNRIANQRDQADLERERRRELARARTSSAATGNVSFGLSQTIADEFARAAMRGDQDTEVRDETLSTRRKNIRKTTPTKVMGSLMGGVGGSAGAFGMAYDRHTVGRG